MATFSSSRSREDGRDHPAGQETLMDLIVRLAAA
jgi:hypothetical protein